jgi:RNA polymerase sigma-70 factor (ECF subfamily)
LTQTPIIADPRILEPPLTRIIGLRDLNPPASTSPVEDPDGPLIVAVACGDQTAVRTLVDRHMTKLYAVSFRLLKNKEDADEVVQEVFLKVWTHAAKWEPGRAKFETWMHRVAINLCYDRLRKHREVIMDEVPDTADEKASPAGELQQRQVSTRLRLALEALPIRQRTAIELCHYQEFTNIEGAEIMEISVDAMESLLARGRRALKAALSAEAKHLVGGVD